MVDLPLTQVLQSLEAKLKNAADELANMPAAEWSTPRCNERCNREKELYTALVVLLELAAELAPQAAPLAASH